LLGCSLCFFLIKPALAFELSKEERSYLRSKETITFVSQTIYPPFEFVGHDGDHTGMCIELVRWIATQFGFKAHFIDMSFKDAQQAVLSGKVDVLTSLFYSKKREKIFDFTKVMFEVPASIFVVAERPDIKELKDLSGKTIAMQAGDYALEFLKAKNITFEVVYTKNFAQATDLVIAKKADAIVGDEQIVMYHIFSNNLTKKIKKVGEPLYIGQNCMGVNGSNPILISILNKGIDLAIEQGVLNRIQKKWIGIQFTAIESIWYKYVPHLLVVMGMIILLSASAWFWNVKLRQQIALRTEALKNSEEQFQFITEKMDDIVWTLDRDFMTTYVSPSIKSVLGFTPEERKQQAIEKRITPESLQRVQMMFLEELAKDDNGISDSDRSVTIEVEYYHRDGSTVWVENKVKAIRDSPGSIIGFIGVSRDIAERKRTEEALRESEKKHRLLAENTVDCIWQMNLDQEFTYINQAVFPFLGYTPKEFIGSNLSEHCSSEELNKMQEQILNVLANLPDKTTAVFETSFYHKNGEEIPSEIIGKILLDDAGNPIYIQGTTRNITERRQAEVALRESERLYRLLADNVDDNIWTMDMKMKFTFISPSITRMRGYSVEEAMAQAIDETITPASLDIALKAITEELEQHNQGQKPQDRSRKVELELNCKDGSTVWSETEANFIYDDDGQPQSIIGVTRDITERKQHEKALRESEEKLARSKKMESLGLLAGGVAHDLNNVLSGIVSYPELILMDLPEDSKLRNPIETIQESGNRAAEIVQDLLTVARGVATAKEPLNLNDLIGDYLHSPEFNKLKQFYPTAAIKTHLDTDLFNISGSHVHIRKVVMNLVSNASEALEGSGNITISTVNRYIDRPLRGYDDVNIGEYAILSVSDDGSGISSDDLERIFEPFYTKKIMGRSGTGLGLAVVWNTVQDHKGYIDVTIQEKGTTFELYFPITRDEISDKDLSMPIKDYKGNQETILVVDDMENQREISCKMLDKLGYKTKAVSSGEEAVKYLRENTIDLLLLDMIMDPGINGRETYERIIKIHPNQRAIIVSGFAQTDEVKQAQKLGAGQYIKKPVTLEKIGLAVKEELGK